MNPIVPIEAVELQGIILACLGLTFFGMYTRMRIWTLLSVPMLMFLAIEQTRHSYILAFGFVLWLLFNLYWTFFEKE